MATCSVPTPPCTSGPASAAAGADAAMLAATLRLMHDPATYSPTATRIEAIETHMSWVFLVDGLAYKLKKPVTYPFLDFGTIDARKADCRAELRLNRRLAPGVYLGASRILRAPDGGLTLVDDRGDGHGDGGDGDSTDSGDRRGAAVTVDWLVRMRRLPAERTLDALIRDGRAGAALIAPLGRLLADFYRHLPPADLDPDAYLARLSVQHRASEVALRDATGLPAGVVPGRTLDGIARALDRARTALSARARAGRIVEGHGDLRPEHVFMLAVPVVIDCLEFSRDLRLVDWADEVAFLGLECERLGAPAIGPALRGTVSAALADPVDDPLFDLYGALRACLRARLALAHLGEPQPRTPQRWPRLAADYLQLAQARVARLVPPS